MRELRWKRTTWNGIHSYLSYGEFYTFQVVRREEGWRAHPAPVVRGWGCSDSDRALADTRFRTLRDAKLACVRHAAVD